ncbi:hypothetical protein [Streptomyces sp. NPDC048669]|uniref:hypothetical protein n=1 Tax=Streptomyces sp. NPDC048669 TaxID=3155267 RepID=UPI00342DD64C
MSGVFIFMVIVGLILYGLHRAGTKAGAKYLARQRDREIETYMRLGIRDEAARRRIAEKIADEERRR